MMSMCIPSIKGRHSMWRAQTLKVIQHIITVEWTSQLRQPAADDCQMLAGAWWNPRRSDSATILLDGWVWCVVTNHQLEILETPHGICCLATRFTVSCRINHARLVLTCPANLTFGWNQRLLAACCDWCTRMPVKCLAVHDEPEEVRQCHHPF